MTKGRPAGRPPNRELRTREHLTPAEVERLIEAARGNRRGHRDATMILIAFRHGLRASELVDLRWEQTDLDQAVLHVRRSRMARRRRIRLRGENSGRCANFNERAAKTRSCS